MTANTATLKTASIVLDTPAALATVLGHRQSTAVVVETSKPAAAEALGITLHRFNKWAAWMPQTHEVAGDYAGTVLWRDINAGEDDDAFSWWYLTDEGIPVEIPWGEHAEDEPEADEDEGYSLLMGMDAPEGPQVLIASRHVSLEDEPEGEPETEEQTEARHAEVEEERYCTEEEAQAQHDDGEWEDQEARPPLCQYTEDGSRDFEDELADTVDRLELAVENGEDLDKVRSKATPQLAAHMMDLPELDDDSEIAIPALPTPGTDGVIVLDAKQSAALRERQAAADELTAMDDRALAVKLMMGLNHWDRDEAEKVIDLGGVQSQMWTAAAKIAREHFDA